jgi:prepilin-type N-terminal cleavage/methylation domain-containing protein
MMYREEAMGDSRSRSANSEAGFSAVELAIVVTIVGIISAASVVMFATGKARYQLSQKAQTITGQIERARSLAVKYNQTLTLGFTAQNSVFGITSTNCPEAKTELPLLSMPANITLSAYPTITIKGNGTITVANGTITVSDGSDRHVPIFIANSGRTTVGDITEGSTSH